MANPTAISTLAAIRIEAGRNSVRSIWTSSWMCFNKLQGMDHLFSSGAMLGTAGVFLSKKKPSRWLVDVQKWPFCVQTLEEDCGSGVTTPCQNAVKKLSNSCHSTSACG